jgi:hypothetical protein
MGLWRSLGARLVRNQEVVGSIPTRSTNLKIRLDIGRFDTAGKCIGLLNEFGARAWTEHVYSSEKVENILNIGHRMTVANLKMLDYFKHRGF